MKNFIGQDGFVWWIGKVVNINDPLSLGRCRVRIFGYHGEERDIPNDDLPWAIAIHPINTPNLYGTPRVNDFVFGFFLDAGAAQEPAMLGYFPYSESEEVKSFSSVTEKDSVVLDINGAKIAISNTGNVTITANGTLTLTSGGNMSLTSNGTLTLTDSTNSFTLSSIKSGLDAGLVNPVAEP